jgi:hypothetical protein
MLAEYSRWTALLDTAAKMQVAKQFPSGSKLQARARSILAFAGAA